ncbi:transmembrane protein 47-like isoform X4 [Varroa jacobsoni]|uniref:transmembrane protein 47-like isoform X4 n=1 Tax=Varroa jacobsoni TaxID=62625 RepID=UPI000BF830BD|nr:transmembrane protein 47-like isoform X4 [Varroa jacobsoni]XP_022693600.1 transmembrane protein 47-like isoform X4 [Varroa jacobsoni]
MKTNSSFAMSQPGSARQSQSDLGVINSTIETVHIVRPLKVFAFICGLIVVLLMILSILSSSWLVAQKYRQGLWEQCVEEGALKPLPFGLEVGPGCYGARNVAYVQAAAALCVITLLCDVAATLMTGCGLCSRNPVRKYMLYRLAFYVMVCALLCILIALVVYPACFAAEIEDSNRQVWEFGWAYGVGWGAAIFLFGGILLLLCDKETEEIYYRERTTNSSVATVHDNKA